jgi:uncharacterized protein
MKPSKLLLILAISGFASWSTFQAAAQVPPVAATPSAPGDKEKANQNTVLILGSSGSSIYSKFAEDMFKVLDDRKENGLRVLPITSRGAVHNVFDILNLQNVDMGLTESIMLEHYERLDTAKYGNIRQRIQYIAKLANTEYHIITRKEITDLRQLAGKKVDFYVKESGTALVGQDLFKLLGIPVEPVFSFADEELRPRLQSGEIAASARASTAPGPFQQIFKPEDNLHLLPIDSSLPGYEKVRAKYFPAVLTSEQYPNLLPPGETVPVIANATVLAVYAWPENTERYRKVANFVNQFFNNIEKFMVGSAHPRWREINLAAEVPGWTRFKAADDWLKARKSAGGQTDNKAVRAAFDQFLARQQSEKGKPLTAAEKEKLSADFLDWWGKRTVSGR